MSILTTYIQKKQHLKRIQEELDRLKDDERLKAEIQFKDKLESLMREFDKTAEEVISIIASLDISQKTTSSKSDGNRAKRKLKIFKNPYSGEIVETRGSNQNTIKAWKREHGSETVEEWLVRTES